MRVRMRVRRLRVRVRVRVTVLGHGKVRLGVHIGNDEYLNSREGCLSVPLLELFDALFQPHGLVRL